MPNYKEGLNRHQQLLFPPSLDEYVDENNPARAIESYVDTIDLAALGVFTTSGGSEGQPIELILLQKTKKHQTIQNLKPERE